MRMKGIKMSELRQPQFYNETGQDKEKNIPVLVGPNLEAHNFSSMEDLEAFIPDEDIKKALGLAGAWSDLGISEDELFKRLERIRRESEPAPLIKLD